MSYLSSHHSDDASLLDLSPPSSPTESITISYQDSYETHYREISIPDSPASPVGVNLEQDTSSSSSSESNSSGSSPSSASTVRPEVIGFRDSLNEIRGQLQALWDGQTSTNHMLDGLRAPRTPDNAVPDRLRNIEGMVQRLLERSPPAPSTIPLPAPPEPVRMDSPGSSELSSLRSLFDTVRMPIPQRHSSISRLLESIVAADADRGMPQFSPPPALRTLDFRPRQERRQSPVQVADQPPVIERPATFPIPVIQPVRFDREGRRQVPRRPQPPPQRPLGDRRHHPDNHVFEDIPRPRTSEPAPPPPVSVGMPTPAPGVAASIPHIQGGPRPPPPPVTVSCALLLLQRITLTLMSADQCSGSRRHRTARPWFCTV